VPTKHWKGSGIRGRAASWNEEDIPNVAAVYALLKKSTLLAHKGKSEAARKELTKLIVQFQGDVDPRVLELVNSAWKSLAGEAEEGEGQPMF